MADPALPETPKTPLPEVVPPIVTSWDQGVRLFAQDSSIIGGKAVGLFLLPSFWVPPFLVLTKQFNDSWLSEGGNYDALRSLLLRHWNLVEALERKASLLKAQRLLVRSNGLTENITQRGASSSTVVRPQLEDISKSIWSLFVQSTDNIQCPIVQPAIEPAVLGHISNERRVSAKLETWLVESTHALPSQYIHAEQHKDPCDLKATNSRELMACLRNVCGHLLSLNRSCYHCEWVWDSQKVWIVQADEAIHTKESAISAYLASHEDIPEKRLAPFSYLKYFSDVESQLHKLRCPLLFKKLGLPTADIYVLSGENWAKSLKERHAELAEELATLAENAIVVRCDISEEKKDKELLLPTSKPSREVSDLLVFMETTASKLGSLGFSESQWAFLIATLVPARASAMIHAFPGAQRIRVDALWGFPDGLLYFPHDTYSFYVESGKIRSKPGFKGTALFARPDWKPEPVPPPFDWRKVLSKSEVAHLARWGRTIADELQHEIQLMSLARIGGVRGPKGCLPWHFTSLVLPKHSGGVPFLPRLKKLHTVADEQDLLIAGRPDEFSKVEGLLLRPSQRLLRNYEFLKQAGDLAASFLKPIYFEGSLLGHAYYILSSSGAPVIPVLTQEEVVEPTRYEKLVRDHVPAVIQRAGGVARVRNLSRQEARVLLSQKVIEEAFEVWTSSDAKISEELADLIEVAEALREYIGLSKDELERIRLAKRQERGGFERLIFLEETYLRSLEAFADERGALPLSYAETGVSTQTRAAIDTIRPTDNTLDILRLAIPLIPPVRRGQALRNLINRNQSFEVRISYRGAEAIVTVRRYQPTAPSTQLSLFPNMDYDNDHDR